MPTLGGSPAKAGNGTAAAAAAAATAVGTCVLLEMNAGTQAQMARRASRTTLSSCDPLRAIITRHSFKFQYGGRREELSRNQKIMNKLQLHST
jgi:hypothetical protein